MTWDILPSEINLILKRASHSRIREVFLRPSAEESARIARRCWRLLKTRSHVGPSQRRIAPPGTSLQSPTARAAAPTSPNPAAEPTPPGTLEIASCVLLQVIPDPGSVGFLDPRLPVLNALSVQSSTFVLEVSWARANPLGAWSEPRPHEADIQRIDQGVRSAGAAVDSTRRVIIPLPRNS